MRHARRAVVFALALAACDRADRTTEKPPADPPAPTAKVPAPPVVDAPALSGCAALTRADCLTSTDCTLHRIRSNRYECRAATGPCETGLVQEDRRACEARAACTFVPGTCYCMCASPGVMRVPDSDADGVQCGCACGGGPPSMCVERSATK